VTNGTKKNVLLPGVASSFGFRRPQTANHAAVNNIAANENASNKTPPKKLGNEVSEL